MTGNDCERVRSKKTVAATLKDLPDVGPAWVTLLPAPEEVVAVTTPLL